MEKESWKEKRGKAIIDALADEGATYGEAQAIIKAAEWELGRRKHEDKVKKNKAKKQINNHTPKKGATT